MRGGGDGSAGGRAVSPPRRRGLAPGVRARREPGGTADCSRARGTPPLVTARGEPSMCDYSLQHVASRPAKVGDELVSTKFHNSITRGFAAGDDPNVAVCLLPGTELAFESDVEYDPALGPFLPNRKVGEYVARVRKDHQDQPHDHPFAHEFPCGHILLLPRL